MGVAGFYRWLVQRYPLIRKCLDIPSRPKFNNLYIDFNCIIYNALRMVSASNTNLEPLFDEVCRYLDLLVQIIRPETVLFIAVDGPAPFAKCAQQRTRRFLAARDSKGGSFDTTCISVGTEFMEKMNQRLIEFIKTRSKEDQIWMKPQIIYSSHRVPGEGEHKFFDYIRTQMRLNSEITEKIVHCVYSPDADLIFLGLQTKLPYFYILREQDSWVGPNEGVGNGKLNKLKATESDFELLCLSICREFFHLEYKGNPDVNRTIDDFAVFCFLIGNDFIPHFSEISIKDEAFEMIIQTYQNAIMSKGLYLIDDDGKINKKVLKQLLLSWVQSKTTKSGSKNKVPANEKSNEDAIKEQLNEDAINYLRNKYPEEYAKDPIDLERRLSFAILDSFDWVFHYYTKGCPSWTWHFPYFYAPHLVTIAKYCEEHVSKFDLDRPPLPLEQLLCILPPQSSKFLPEAAQHLMTSPELKQFYPSTFDVDLNGRRYEHEGVVLIPFVDIQLIREEVQKIHNQLTEEEIVRNTIACDLLIGNGESRNFSIETDIPTPPKEPPTCLPSLFCANFSFSGLLRKLKVNIFKTPSTANSLFLTQYTSPKKVPTLAQQVECLLNAPVLIGWPYLFPALVMEIFDAHGNVINKDGPKKLSEQSAKQKIAMLTQKFKQQLAIDINNTSIVLVVKSLISTRMNEDLYKFQPRLIYYPYQLSVSCHHPGYAQRFVTPSIPLPQVGSIAVIIDGPNQSKKCIIKSIDVDNKEAEILVLNNEKPLLDLCDIFANDEKQWDPIDPILGNCQIDYDQARMFLSSIPLSDKTSALADVAFTAFADKKVLDGFVRKNGDNYEFTKEFQYQLFEYITSEVVGCLMECIRDLQPEKRPKVLFSDIYPKVKPKDKQATIARLAQYLKDKCISQFFLIDESISTVSQTTLQAIELKLNTQPKHQQQEETESTIYEKFDNLIWPGKPKMFLQKRCEKGSRVINLTHTGPIPFGERGYVVSVDKFNYQYHIILDNECQYATNLRKRLTSKRGYIAKIDDLYFY